jgi:hypothetical protein
MTANSRTSYQPENPDDVYEKLERTMERAEQRMEAQIDSIGACEPTEAAEAECTAARVSAHRASAAAGVHSGNTPPSTSKSDEIRHWIGAEDWLEWCLYVQWTDWAQLNRRFKLAKEDAAVDGTPPELCNIHFIGGRAAVEPSGRRIGGKKGPYFAYCLDYDGLTVLIAERENPHKTFPSVIAWVDGTNCLYPGAYECYEKITRMIEALGGKILRNRLSRVDICLDMPGIGTEPFEQAFMAGRYICRATTKRHFSGSGTTVGIGQAPLMCRIYDKLAEVKLKANPIKALGMRVFRWGRIIPDQATRVEFELRREALKSRGIDSVEDYYAKRSDLVHYLTSQWLRFTETPVDRENNNQSKARTLPLWKDVRRAFRNWAGSPSGTPLEPLPKEKADVRNLLKQLLGVGQTAAEYQGKEIQSVAELLKYVEKSTSDYGIRFKPKKKAIMQQKTS